MHSHFGFQMCDGISIPLLIKRLPVPNDYPLAESLNQAEEVVMFLQGNKSNGNKEIIINNQQTKHNFFLRCLSLS